MIALTGVDIRLDPAPHPFELVHGAAIDAGWERSVRANPALFDGQVTLVSGASIADGVLHATCHMVRFATLLHWTRHPREGQGEHVFAHAAPIGSDGGALAVRMAAHTANAGMCYFAAGSIDGEDIVDGRVDLPGNMRREVAEETGIDLDLAQAERSYHLWRGEGFAVIVRRYRFAETAEALAERTRAHVARDSEPEITGPVILKPGSSRPDKLGRHMGPLLDWLETDPPFDPV